MGKVVERREEAEEKKKDRPSLLDVRKRTLKGKQQQKRTHSASTCPNPDEEELDSDDSVSDYSDDSVTDESEIEREIEAYRRNGRLRGLTDEERVRYREQVCKSDGFDVAPVPPDVLVMGGLIQPLDISKKSGSTYRTCKIISQRAIDQIHKRRERRTVKPHTPLKFVKVLKAMDEFVDGLRYYVTFEAKDVGDGGQTKIFQALARFSRFNVGTSNFSLLTVREYKGEKGDRVIVIHSASELEKRLEEASRTSRLAILFFSKARPCRFISPLYASLAVKYPKVVFLKVHIEEGPNAESMALDRGIRKFPTFLFYKSGEEVDKVVGVDAFELERKVPLHSRKQTQATRDQVIVIHSASELEKRLEEASRTSRLAILFFSKARPRHYISLYASLAVKYPKVVFLKVDIEEGPNAEGMAVDRGISKFPTFLIYKSGKEVDKVVGLDAIELDRKIPLHSRKRAS